MSSVDNNFYNKIIDVNIEENKEDINKENIKKLKDILSFKKEESNSLKKESFKIIDEEMDNFEKVEVKIVDDDKENQDYAIHWSSLSEEDVKELLSDSFKRCHRTIVCYYLVEEYRKEPTQKKAKYILEKFLDSNGRFGINYGKQEVGKIIKNASEKILSSNKEESNLNKEESKKKKERRITKFFSNIIYTKSKEDLRKTKSLMENMDKELFDGVLSCNSDYLREAFTYLSWKKSKEEKKKLLESVKDKKISLQDNSTKKKHISTKEKRLSHHSNLIRKEKQLFYDEAKEAGFNIPKFC